jgi:formylglycine-generating enzyme required for sulfatase activity
LGFAPLCSEIFLKKVSYKSPSSTKVLTEQDFLFHLSQKIVSVPEFAFIRNEASSMGLRVWIFGGTASSFIYYAKQDFLSLNEGSSLPSSGSSSLSSHPASNPSSSFFNFQLSSIFRHTQDLDIVIDGTPQEALSLQKTLNKTFPFFLGSKRNNWEVRTLRVRMGTPGHSNFKEALLNDSDFRNQHTDSHSVGLIEVTQHSESPVRDLHFWHNHTVESSSFKKNQHQHLSHPYKQISGEKVISHSNDDPNNHHPNQGHDPRYNSTENQNHDSPQNYGQNYGQNYDSLRNHDKSRSPSPSKLSLFLKDVLKDEITYLPNPLHSTTIRFQEGQNPQILSVIRLLVKAFQYDLKINATSYQEIRKVIEAFQPENIQDALTLNRIHYTSRKLILHSANLDYAKKVLEDLGLKDKLISMGNPNKEFTFSWWLSQSPLSAQAVGQGQGPRASDLKLHTVFMEVGDLFQYEFLLKQRSLHPNLLKNHPEGVQVLFPYQDLPSKNTIKVVFKVNPLSRLGSDFIEEGTSLIFKNKNALLVTEESLSTRLENLSRLISYKKKFNKSSFSNKLLDPDFLEKIKTRLSPEQIRSEIDSLILSKSLEDFNHFIKVLRLIQDPTLSKMLSQHTLLLDIHNLYQSIKDLSHSSKESDLLKYTRFVSTTLPSLISLNLITKQDFLSFLTFHLKEKIHSSDFKKEILFEFLLLLDSPLSQIHFISFLNKKDPFFALAFSELAYWHLSKDQRKKEFAIKFHTQWSELIEKADLSKMESLIDSGLVTINHTNISGSSILLLATYYNRHDVISWLSNRSDFDYGLRNNLDLNPIEQLYFNGKYAVADRLLKEKPELAPLYSNSIYTHKQFLERNASQVTAEYPHGTPFIDFVRIEPQTFILKNENPSLVGSLKQVSQPFEVLSVDVTQKMYRDVTELIKSTLADPEYQRLKSSPSTFKGDFLPVETLSFHDTDLWIRGLNELSSSIERLDIQTLLSRIFPGHQPYQVYSKPTYHQWLLVSQLGGFSDHHYSHGKDESDLKQYSIYKTNSRSKTWPVGYKKPFFYNGKPLYDLSGNVSKWIDTPTASSILIEKQNTTRQLEQLLEQQVDPQTKQQVKQQAKQLIKQQIEQESEPFFEKSSSKSFRIYKDGNFLSSDPSSLKIHSFKKIKPWTRLSSIGLRLVRSVESTDSIEDQNPL